MTDEQTDPGWALAAEAAKVATPIVLGWIDDLIKAGHSPGAAGEIVARNIQSRREQYERDKAEDERRLAAKHGRGEGPDPAAVAALRGHKVDLRGASTFPDLPPPVPARGEPGWEGEE